MIHYLWRPMSIVPIVCIWSFMLCNGKITKRTSRSPLDQLLDWRFLSAFAKLKTHVTLMLSFLPFPPFLRGAPRIDI